MDSPQYSLANGLEMSIVSHCPETRRLLMILGMGLETMGDHGEFIVPSDAMEGVDAAGVAYLEEHVSYRMEAPVLSFFDTSNSVWRVMRKPDLPTGPYNTSDNNTVIRSSSGEEDHDATSSSSPAVEEVDMTKRCANHFLLYRNYWQKVKKQELAGYGNCEQSVIIGAWWKNEPDSVRKEWKKKYDDAARTFKTGHPDYVYKPRKAGEKKRRKSSRNNPKMSAQKKQRLTQFAASFKDETKKQLILPAPPATLSPAIEHHNSTLDTASVPQNPDPFMQNFTNDPASSSKEDYDLTYGIIDWNAIDLDLEKVNEENAPIDVSQLTEEEIANINDLVKRVSVFYQ
ncbi:MAG: hypothetical protein Q9227_001647 [Pyrenula ochraceoflavens]